MGSTESTAVRSLLNGVRLVVQRGASRRTSMELLPAEPLTRIVIGSSSQCDWRIFARGVRARHLRLVWSHGRLRIDDVCEPGAVKLDGRPVCHRIELCAAASVSFGEAVLAVEPVSGAGPAPSNLSAEAATVQNGLVGQVQGSSAGPVIDAPTAEQALRERQVRGKRR